MRRSQKLDRVDVLMYPHMAYEKLEPNEKSGEHTILEVFTNKLAELKIKRTEVRSGMTTQFLTGICLILAGLLMGGERTQGIRYGIFTTLTYVGVICLLLLVNTFGQLRTLNKDIAIFTKAIEALHYRNEEEA